MPETLTRPPVEEAVMPAQPQAEALALAPVVPDGFSNIAEALYQETELAKRDELKARAAEALSPAIEALAPEEVPAYLDEVNESYNGVFSGEDLCLLSASRENLVIVNSRGELQEVEVTEENAKDVLGAVKAADAEKKLGHSYALRHEVLKRSEGTIPTYKAYTYAEELPKEGDPLNNYLDDPESWVPERRQLQQEIVDNELTMAHQMSERLGDDNPTLYVLRGNTAAGKTTAVKTSPSFEKALDDTGEPTGSINPDTYKATLKEEEAENETQTVNHYQAHEEGSMISRQVEKRLKESESSMVIDKRTSKKKNVTSLIQLAEASGREVKIMDVDVPLEISLVRVLERPVGGDSPNVPFGPVAEGFAEIRENREHLLETVQTDEKIVDYVLKVADDAGKSVEVARKVDGKFVMDEANLELYYQSIDSDSTKATVADLAETVITDEYIDEYVSRVHGDEPEGSRASHTRDSLNRYKGKTLKQALDERASLLNE